MAERAQGWDVAVIGAGVVGCAVAWSLARAGAQVVLAERARMPGTQTSSRNSQVVHAGLYYPIRSLKAETCVRGKALLLEYCARHGVPCRRTGKLVVARGPARVTALEELFSHARACGVTDLEWVEAKRAAALEPALTLDLDDRALWSPGTAIVDAPALARSLWDEAERLGADVLHSCEVSEVIVVADGFRLATTRGPAHAAAIVNAAGFGADAIAAGLGLPLAHVPCRGDYFAWVRSPAYRRLIYPVRAPGDAGLGIHVTLDLDGRVRLGPDADFDASPDDLAPREHKAERFALAASALLGPVQARDLRWDGCGIRPRLAAAGRPPADFRMVERPTGALHLLGIESPGLTASLALAERVTAWWAQGQPPPPSIDEIAPAPSGGALPT